MKKKIQIYGSNLGFGGIEREISVLANCLSDMYDIEVIFLKKDKDVILDFNSSIKVTILNIDKISIFNSNKIKNSIDTSISNTVISTNVIFNKYINKYAIGKKIYWEHNHHDNSLIELNVMKKELVGFEKIIVPSEELYDFYKKITDEVVIINNSISGIPLKFSKLDNNNITYIGKLNNEKGILELLDVFKLVHDKNKLSKLYLVGEGPLMKNIKKFREDNNIVDNIRILGNLNRNDINKVLFNTSVFVTCSKSESFGISVVEAMSYGIPVVAFNNIPSFKMIIDDEINGFMIENQDKVEMAKRILFLLKNKDAARKVGECAREKANSFDIKVLKTEWLKVI